MLIFSMVKLSCFVCLSLTQFLDVLLKSLIRVERLLCLLTLLYQHKYHNPAQFLDFQRNDVSGNQGAKQALFKD